MESFPYVAISMSSLFKGYFNTALPKIKHPEHR